MASLILGASILTYNKIKETRAKKREKKLWRENSYAELERETAERLAKRDQRMNQVTEKGRDAVVGRRASSDSELEREKGRIGGEKG